MRNEKIGIFGASGFVGSALCERLFLEGDRNLVAFIHTSGNAARIARFPMDIRSVDLMDRKQVCEVVSGCTAVVNCSRGSEFVMTRGLRHILEAVKQARVGKFIHLSSIGIYGDDPDESSRTESGVPVPGRNAYGRMKLHQDEWVFQLHESGVSSYILCPDNIGGPYSSFVLALATRLAAGPFPLVDGGRYPTNVVHVDNLVQAIVAAIDSKHGAGERYFVNEEEEVSWRRYCADLAGLLDFDCTFTEVTRDEALACVRSRPGRAGLVDHFKIALSSEFRRGLALMPAFAWLNEMARRRFEALPFNWQAAVRERAERPRIVTKETSGPPLDEPYVRLQLRRFYHCPDKLGHMLGYKPALTYSQGMQTTAAWLRAAGAAQGTQNQYPHLVRMSAPRGEGSSPVHRS